MGPAVAGRPLSAPAKAPTPPGPDDFPDSGPNALAEPWQRALGVVLDTMVCFTPALVLALFPAALGVAPETGDELVIWVVGALAVVLVAYQVVCLAVFGQTAAMWIVGIRCARFLDGKKPQVGQAAIRSLVPAVASVVPYTLGLLSAVVYTSAFYNPLLRAWHDQASGTIVVRTR
jgi:uncharacterized RDD family membrane protein YckC